MSSEQPVLKQVSDPSVHIVVIDHNEDGSRALCAELQRPDLVIHCAPSAAEGLRLVRALRPRLVITNLVMPEQSGMDVLREVMQIDPTIDVVLMTAYYTTESAVEAIRSGAADYVEKPVRVETLKARIAKLLTSARQRQRVLSRLPEGAQEYNFEGMVARSPCMWQLFNTMTRVATHFSSLLIQGETGTGKDMVAQALHNLSKSPGPFVVLNCSAIVETLFESELFGHVRGAFTGATRDKLGLIEAAEGGTLFLDEIGDTPLATQAKLLRALQNREVQPVGALTPRKVNVKVVAATNRDLRLACQTGAFRQDLYFRLSMLEIRVPALRERPEDLPLLISHFVRNFSSEFRKPINTVAPRAMRLLEQYGWPGNVRELEHVIGRAILLNESGVIDVSDLPEALSRPGAQQGQLPQESAMLSTHEKQLLQSALQQAEGNQSQAARILGIGRDALRYKIKKYGL